MIIDVFDAEVVEWDENAGSKFRDQPVETAATAESPTQEAAPGWEAVTLPGVAETLATWKVPNTLRDIAAEKKQGKGKKVKRDGDETGAGRQEETAL